MALWHATGHSVHVKVWVSLEHLHPPTKGHLGVACCALSVSGGIQFTCIAYYLWKAIVHDRRKASEIRLLLRHAHPPLGKQQMQHLP